MLLPTLGPPLSRPPGLVADVPELQDLAPATGTTDASVARGLDDAENGDADNDSDDDLDDRTGDDYDGDDEDRGKTAPVPPLDSDDQIDILKQKQTDAQLTAV